MTTEIFLALITGLGIGSIVTASIQHILKRREATLESQQQDLEKRYRVIILLMYAAIDFDKNRPTLQKNRPDLQTINDVLDELKTEWHNMTLFSSKPTLENLISFIKQPSNENFRRTAQKMRKDLQRGNINLLDNNLNF